MARSPDPDLLAAAQAGLLTRRNTLPGSPERRVVYRAEYVKRVARHPGLSARAAAGHGPRVAGTGTFFSSGPNGPAVLAGVQLGRGDLRRAGRYMGLVSQLVEGRLSSAAFERRVRAWKPVHVLGTGEPIERRFLSDSGAVLALADALRSAPLPGELFDSGRRRPTSPSRGR